MSSVPSRAATYYFEQLLTHAERTASEGNYAIAAALAITGKRTEVVVIGVNTLFSDHDPCGHAEINALRRTRRLARDVAPLGSGSARLREDAKDTIMLRPATGPPGELRLYSSLEPCPMCTVALINAGVHEVIVANEDTQAGALAAPRAERMPQAWRDLIAEIDVRWTQTDDPTVAETFLPGSLADRLTEIFERSRGPLDERIRSGVLDVGPLVA